MGYVTGAEPFILASYVISGVLIGGLAIWAVVRLHQARKRLTMLELTRKENEDKA